MPTCAIHPSWSTDILPHAAFSTLDKCVAQMLRCTSAATALDDPSVARRLSCLHLLFYCAELGSFRGMAANIRADVPAATLREALAEG